jgi:hypothetical protein
MNKIILLTALSILTTTVYSQKNCSINLKINSSLKKASDKFFMDKANELTKNSDIEIVTTDSDYSLSILAYDSYDHHDARYKYLRIISKLWPSDKDKKRSAYEYDVDSNYKKKRKFNKKRVTKYVMKSLKHNLKSCAQIDSLIKSNGFGTLDPKDGDTFETSTGSIFKRVGNYWEDPSGMLWGETLEGRFKNADVNSPAVMACKVLGANLPSADDYRRLVSYFGQSKNINQKFSKKGQFEFNALFPWSNGSFFTSTRDQYGVGLDFFHNIGRISEAMAHWELNVRCVK